MLEINSFDPTSAKEGIFTSSVCSCCGLPSPHAPREKAVESALNLFPGEVRNEAQISSTTSRTSSFRQSWGNSGLAEVNKGLGTISRPVGLIELSSSWERRKPPLPLTSCSGHLPSGQFSTSVLSETLLSFRLPWSQSSCPFSPCVENAEMGSEGGTFIRWSINSTSEKSPQGESSEMS